MADLYVIALLGESPAVLTELAWWLTCRPDAQGSPKNEVSGQDRIVGFEVWTTNGIGTRAFESMREKPNPWVKLAELAGNGRIPLYPGGTPAPPPPRWDDAARDEVTVGRFRRNDGSYLDDVRSREDSALVERTLHDRVAQLAAMLPASVVLVGSLAGGRKTMSASLQSAFSLRARPQDRLVHVLMTKTADDAQAALRGPPVKREKTPTWWFPGAPSLSHLMEPEPDPCVMLDVFEVPAPPISALVGMEPADQRSLLGAPMAELLDALFARHRALPRVVVQQGSGAGWVAELIDGNRKVATKKIGFNRGLLWAAIVAAGRAVSLDEILALICVERRQELNRHGWLVNQDDPKAANASISENLSEFAAQIRRWSAEHPSFPFSDLVPHRVEGTTRWDVTDRSRVDVVLSRTLAG